MTTTAALLEAAAPLEGERAARAIWTAIAEPNNATIGRLIAAHGAIDALAVILDGAASDVEGLEPLRGHVTARATVGTIARVTRVAQHVGAHLITPGTAEWPAQLDDLGETAPVALWLRGEPAVLGAQTITVLTGARAATAYGEHMGRTLAFDLIERGHTLAAGAAYGIDAVTHAAALSAGSPTIAALAGGVDRFYPAGHDSLLTRIAETGAVISEVACGEAPTKWRFLARGRMLAALAGWTVIVESGIRSGCLNLAGHAAALGRPVGAIPGPLTSPASTGCHALIREQGAALITSAADLA